MILIEVAHKKTIERVSIEIVQVKFSGMLNQKAIDVKVIFLNDGPGLLLGSMWSDYAHIENSWHGKVKVVTLRMFSQKA